MGYGVRGARDQRIVSRSYPEYLQSFAEQECGVSEGNRAHISK